MGCHSGTITPELIDEINERWIGHHGVKLPEEGDICYACPSNKQRNAVSSSIFKKHVIDTHPLVTMTNDPPHHTIVIEAVFRLSLIHI